MEIVRAKIFGTRFEIMAKFVVIHLFPGKLTQAHPKNYRLIRWPVPDTKEKKILPQMLHLDEIVDLTSYPFTFVLISSHDTDSTAPEASSANLF